MAPSAPARPSARSGHKRICTRIAARSPLRTGSTLPESSEDALAALLSRESAPDTVLEDAPSQEDAEDESRDTEMDDGIPTEPPPPAPKPAPSVPRPRAGADAAARLNTAWSVLLPSLEAPYAEYWQTNYGQRPSIIPSRVTYECTASCGFPVNARIQCLTFPISNKWRVVGPAAACRLAVLLVQTAYSQLHQRVQNRGIIDHSRSTALSLSVPATPSQLSRPPSIQSTTAAGFRVLAQNHPAPTPEAPDVVMADEISSTPTATADDASNPVPWALPYQRRHLVQSEYTPTVAVATHPPPGGDVQLGADGCFSYRHLRSAGDGPIDYDPTYFVPKENIAKVNERIIEARKRKSTTYKPRIPQDAIDACQESWNTANEKKQKTDPKYYDASGVFVMTCRHSQVIYLCDIDTPGRTTKATILQAYDVGCVTDHSFNLVSPFLENSRSLRLINFTVPILSAGFRERVSFIINAMHVFGHRWICQLVYSPRCHDGAGLSDMEGVERFLVTSPEADTTYTSTMEFAPDLDNRSVHFIHQSGGSDGLGAWLTRQLLKNLPKKRKAAAKTLRDCDIRSFTQVTRKYSSAVPIVTVTPDAPVRLRRELDKPSSPSPVANALQIPSPTFRSLQATHETLNSQAEALYASLNIHTSFPELRGLPLDFVRTLVIMRDLKMNIRDRAIESFYEWETLDRAVAGKREL
ncbi:hypothetical protein B0H14DRAFT_3466335 [Mycena olivaceomarginata]|nr:hypothetical protein B0H14DRAFT_3466335 [Mycena olivaceomarginata]